MFITSQSNNSNTKSNQIKLDDKLEKLANMLRKNLQRRRMIKKKDSTVS